MHFVSQIALPRTVRGHSMYLAWPVRGVFQQPASRDPSLAHSGNSPWRVDRLSHFSEKKTPDGGGPHPRAVCSNFESLDAAHAGEVRPAAREAIPEAPELLAFPDGQRVLVPDVAEYPALGIGTPCRQVHVDAR
jgi:hypothetical protein